MFILIRRFFYVLFNWNVIQSLLLVYNQIDIMTISLLQLNNLEYQIKFQKKKRYYF